MFYRQLLRPYLRKPQAERCKDINDENQILPKQKRIASCPVHSLEGNAEYHGPKNFQMKHLIFWFVRDFFIADRLH